LSGYISRRVLLSLLTLLVITAAVYAAIRLVPGGPSLTSEAEAADPAGAILAQDAHDAWLRRCHVLDPIPIGYARWLADIARLDFGVSVAVAPGERVSSIIAEALPYTLLLGAMAFALTWLLAVPLGILSAWRPDAASARIWAGALYLLHALPAFWIALALQRLAAGWLGILPALGAGPLGAGSASAGMWFTFLTSVPHWVLPTLAVTLGSLAFVIRFSRTALIDEAARPYARSARARGAGPAGVLCRHALANSAVPLVSLTGLMLPGILSGSVVVEMVFALPGLGRLLFLAASRRDYPVVMALSLLAATATLAATAIADLLYQAADPRLSSREDRWSSS